MIKITEIESKKTPAKKNIQLKNISVENLKLIDTDTGEDLSSQVIDALPIGVDTIDFKITVEIPGSSDDEEQLEGMCPL